MEVILAHFTVSSGVLKKITSTPAISTTQAQIQPFGLRSLSQLEPHLNLWTDKKNLFASKSQNNLPVVEL